MTSKLCPECDAELTVEMINISEGVALCGSCGELSPLSEVVQQAPSFAGQISEPPQGCAIIDDPMHILLRIKIGTLPRFIGMVLVSLFWNGIVSVFALAAMAGLYQNFIGPIPDWLSPDDGGDTPMSMGMTLLLCVFITPFVAAGVMLITVTVLNLAGSTEVAIGESESRVSIGIGFVYWTRRFATEDFQQIYIGRSFWSNNDQPQEAIVLVADRTIKFGSLLPDERREWLRGIMKRLLKASNQQERRALIG